MRLKDYKVGLRVKCIKEHDDNKYIVNKCGTIMKKDEGECFGIKFDEELPKCHSLNGDCEYGHGWYIPPRKLVLVNFNKRID